MDPEPDKSWLRKVFGHEPCPNCAVVDSEPEASEAATQVDREPVR